MSYPVTIKASQDITFDVLSAKTYGDPAFTVSATASSDLPISFGASGQCSIDGTLVSLTGAGSCTITASQAGNTTYEPATPVARTFTIAKAALTVTAQDRTITYGQATPTLGVTYAGFVGTDTAASLGGSLVYTFAGISPAVYGPSTTPPTSVGYYTITPSGLTSNNYAISYAAGTYGISPVVVTTALAWAGDPSPNPVRAGQAITFPGALTDAGSGAAIGQTSLQVYLREATGSSCELPGSTRRDFGTLDADGHVTLSWTPGVADIGTHHLLLAFYQTTVGATNYADATSTCVSVAVTAAKLDQTISFTAPTGVTYGDADLALGATATSSLAVSYASSTPLVCTIASGQLHVVAAGTCTITASQAGNDDYAAAPDVERPFSIAKAAQATLTITGPGVGDVRPRRLRHHDERRLGHAARSRSRPAPRPAARSSTTSSTSTPAAAPARSPPPRRPTPTT